MFTVNNRMISPVNEIVPFTVVICLADKID